MNKLKENVDEWVKDINARVQNVEKLAKVLKDTIDNTEHNYELLQEHRQEIEELKQEIKLLKIISLAMIKSKKNKEVKNYGSSV